MFGSLLWNWKPGDFTFLGWTVTFAYGLAAILCWRRGFGVGRKHIDPEDRSMWRFFSAALLALGLNKQLDLQTLGLRFLRHLAGSQGWYQQRRTVQMIFVIVAVFAGILFFAFLLLRKKNFFRRNPQTLAGLILVIGYLLIRAAGINHIDASLGINLGVKPWLSAMELLACICFIGSSLSASKAPSD